MCCTVYSGETSSEDVNLLKGSAIEAIRLSRDGPLVLKKGTHPKIFVKGLRSQSKLQGSPCLYFVVQIFLHSCLNI